MDKDGIDAGAQHQRFLVWATAPHAPNFDPE
jgi:hypothetical protein